MTSSIFGAKVTWDAADDAADDAKDDAEDDAEDDEEGEELHRTSLTESDTVTEKAERQGAEDDAARTDVANVDDDNWRKPATANDNTDM